VSSHHGRDGLEILVGKWIDGHYMRGGVEILKRTHGEPNGELKLEG